MFIELSKNDICQGNLILVTPKHPLMESQNTEDMEPVNKEQPEIWMRRQAARRLRQILANIHCKDEITAVSGFRTREEQEKIWDDSLSENGLDFTKKYVAVPGHSEHQTGLAVDLAENKGQIDFIRPRFPYAGICGKFREAALQFGFIERYVSGKEEITGIGAEPWHFRYVGYPHSVIMAENGMVLEEYIDFLKENTDFKNPYVYDHEGIEKIEIFYVFLDGKHPVKLEATEMSRYEVSGTNEGGVILSIWGKRHA